MQQTKQNDDKIETLDYAERWMRDGLAVVKQGDFFQSIEVDMSHVNRVLQITSKEGIKISYPHVFVRAAALILSRYPVLHQLITPTKRITPGKVDIGLSVLGRTVVAPVMVIEDAGNKVLNEIAQEVIERAPQVRKEDNEMLANSRKWGRLVPFGCVRRWVLQQIMKSVSFRRKNVGTFQVTCVPNVDHVVPFLFAMSAILAVGGIKERAIVVDGKVEARPTAILSCCADHKVWDGVMASKFLTKLKVLLESDELEKEF